MQFVFSRDRTIPSFLVRAFTWSRWSHVGLLKDGEVVESFPGVGVRSQPFNPSNYSAYEIVEAEFSVDDKALTFAKSQIGKPYDWEAIIGIVLGRNWQNRDRWICSELIAWAYDRAGVPFFSKRESRVTPENLYKFLKNRVESQVLRPTVRDMSADNGPAR